MSDFEVVLIENGKEIDWYDPVSEIIIVAAGREYKINPDSVETIVVRKMEND